MDAAALTALSTTAFNLILGFFSKVSEGAAKKSGEELVSALKRKLSGDSVAGSTLTRLEQAPNDGEARNELLDQLQKILASDVQLSDLLLRLNESAAPSTSKVNMRAGKNATQIGTVAGNVSVRLGRDRT